MKLRLCLVVAVSLMASMAEAQTKAGAAPQLKSVRDRFSYSFGMMIGRNLNKQDIDIDVDLMMLGFRTAMSGGKLLMTEQQAMEAVQAFEKEMAAIQAQEAKEFLAANKKKANVKTTPSGLQYKIVKAGKGVKPRTTDTVKVNYRGTFINGNEFDASTDFTIPVSEVIDGWKEALQMMEVGSRWQLFVPSELAYGEQGQPPIGPNAMLVFDLELLDIVKPPTARMQK